MGSFCILQAVLLGNDKGKGSSLPFSFWFNQFEFLGFVQVYQDGVRNVNVMFIFRHVTLPVVTCLLLAVSSPYVIAAGVVPIFGEYEL